MEAINMVDSGEELKAELNQDKLFRSDVKSVVGKLSPHIAYLMTDFTGAKQSSCLFVQSCFGIP
jgi:hypothetical protein